jgi:hypothetical protein
MTAVLTTAHKRFSADETATATTLLMSLLSRDRDAGEGAGSHAPCQQAHNH